MGYVKLSENEAKQLKILIDNIFITEYVPAAPENHLKIYLTGLSLAYTSPENDIEAIANKLFLDANTILEAFRYWSEQGLVHISPLNEVEYLPVVSKSRQIRKFSKEKYRTFNDQLHVLFPGRNILPNEYNEYYSVMETYNIEVEAMLTIIGYCKRLKGEDITYPYIVTVARNLASEGCTTFDRVSEKITELDLHSSELKAVLKALKLKRGADHDDRRLFNKWTKSFNFKVETVVQVAKNVRKGGTAKLDAQLTKYYENRLLSIEEIMNYEKNRDFLYDLARNINRMIGVYYEQLDFIIESYINPWLSMGFNEDSLTTIADYCFKKGIRTLEGMNDALQKFYKLGYISTDSINGFITEAVKSDEQIKEILENASLLRAVTTRDRDYYRTWTYSWKMPHAVVSYAASLSGGTGNPLSYMNSILASWHENGVTTVEGAKERAAAPPPTAEKTATVVSRDFSTDELNAIFDKLNEEA